MKVSLEGLVCDCTSSLALDSSPEVSHCISFVARGTRNLEDSDATFRITAEDFHSHPAIELDHDSQRANGIAYSFVTNVNREVRYIHRLPKATESNVPFLPSHPD